MICLENTANNRSTYFIINLKLSKLFTAILKGKKKRLIPILETRLLLRALTEIPFLDEYEGSQILKDLTNCMENHWYSLKDTWNYKIIVKKLVKLQKLVSTDYLIYGSLVICNDNHILWDLKVSRLHIKNRRIKKGREVQMNT